jgi:molybdate transport system permease protein
MSELGNSILLSAEIAVLATLLTCIVAVPLAYVLARRTFFGRSLVEGFLMMPLVLPPTVVGYLILMVFGSRGWPGSLLKEHFDYSIALTFEGAVLASAIVAIPMLYMPARAAFQGIDRDLEDVARMMGANRLQMFWHVGLPLARRGILSGLLLAFARALGEFGATAMVYGIHDKKNTLPILIYVGYEAGHITQTIPAVIALTLVSLVVILVYNQWTKVQK